MNFFGIKRHTCKKLELPLLSSQLPLSFIFIMEKRLLFRSEDLRFSFTGSLLSELFAALGLKIAFALLGSCSPHFSRYRFLTVYAGNLESNSQVLGFFFSL